MPRPIILTKLQALLRPSIRFVLLLTALFADRWKKYDFSSPEDKAVYDFVVVGAGSSGSIIGTRLSENHECQVLVLEAGGTPPWSSVIPIFSLVSFFMNVAEWGYFLNSQHYAMKAFPGRKSTYKRGKVLGGSSSINYMLYTRGSQTDYDNWESLGNPGWAYEDVLPYFKKQEYYDEQITGYNSGSASRAGPVHIGFKSDEESVLEKAFLNAGRRLGYTDYSDYTTPSGIGFRNEVFDISEGIRQSTAEVYLRPNLHRSNFHLTTYAHVVQILFDDSLRAIGVAYEIKGKRRVVYARKEVILSGGAINSPQLLMLSGIGPSDHLKWHNIPVLVDSPGVGQNFMDHTTTGYGLVFHAKKGVSTTIAQILTSHIFIRYLTNRSGYLSYPPGATGWAHVSLNDSYPDWPDIQIVSSGLTITADKGVIFSHSIGYGNDFYTDYFKEAERIGGSFSLNAVNLRPLSRGHVSLRSNDPYEQPNIQPNLLQDPADVQKMIDGIKFVLEIASTLEYRRLGVQLYKKPVPGCERHRFGSDEYWGCFVRHLASTYYHASGTNKMGPDTDSMAVVDNTLRVKGVSNLRVADASIMPQVTSGNTNAPSMMIGEKTADSIKEDWNYDR